MISRTVPAVPSTSTTSPSCKAVVPTIVAHTHGTPYSLLMIAACVSSPPPSHTAAAIRSNAGVQLGDVAAHTSTSPCRSSTMSSACETTRTVPRATPGDTPTVTATATATAAPTASPTPTATATLSSRLPFTPDWTTHVGVAYDMVFSNGWTLTPRVDTSYTGAQFFDAGNSVEVSQMGGVTLWSGSLTLESPDSKWRISANGQNLGDKLYPVAGTSSLSTSSGYAEILYARPRTLSLTASYRF